MMKIFVNGEARQVQEDCTISTLLADLGLEKGRVAVERNREVVPRAQHGDTKLSAHDMLEIVHFVGGG